MEYIAHSDGERVQTLKEHLEGTARLAEAFAGRFGKGDWGYCCGLLHDIGKYSDDFQKKIRENSTAMVDHATAGAKVCSQKGGLYGFLSYCIAGHHAGLPDTGGTQDTGSAPTLEGRKRKRIPDFSAYQREIEIPEIKSVPFDPKTVRNVDFSLSVLIRMLYSCLVDADFLDTENFMKSGQTERLAGDSICLLSEYGAFAGFHGSRGRTILLESGRALCPVPNDGSQRSAFRKSYYSGCLSCSGGYGDYFNAAAGRIQRSGNFSGTTGEKTGFCL